MSADDLARPNVFEIDLGAVERNTAAVRRSIGREVFFFATIKANAYGFGVRECAPAALRGGADGLSLSNLDDAVDLRRDGVRQPILVYPGAAIDRETVKAVESHGLVFSLHSRRAVDAFARHAGGPLKVALKIEVGPERLGVTAEDALPLVRELRGGNLQVHVLHCHPNFPMDRRPPEALRWQYERFVGLIRALAAAGIDVPLRVLASSKVLERTGAEMTLNAVDPGSALFAAGADGRSPMRAVRTRLIQARKVTRSAFLEDSPFPLREGMTMGVIPIGYSDGMHRIHCGQVLVGGRRVPVLGKPSLEYTRLDLTGAPQAREGNEVLIVGRQGGEEITPEEVRVAQGAARIHDVALEIRESVQRVYVGSADANH